METAGIGLVEVYDLDLSVDSKLANISTRGFVQTGDNVLIGGVIVLGESDASVIIRAIGPTLADAVPEGVLADPVLELHDSNGDLITSNDNWKEQDSGDDGQAMKQLAWRRRMTTSRRFLPRSSPILIRRLCAGRMTPPGSPWWKFTTSRHRRLNSCATRKRR